MVNTELLNKKIDESGIKKKVVANRIGVSSTTLRAKINGVYAFDSEQMTQLGEILKLNNDEFMAIFFPTMVEKISTGRAV